jgi:hypothetical protein
MIELLLLIHLKSGDWALISSAVIAILASNHPETHLTSILSALKGGEEALGTA